MNPELVAKLTTEFGLGAEQIDALHTAGVVTKADLNLLSAEEIQTSGKLNLVTAKKIYTAFHPSAAVVPPSASSQVVDPNADIPEGMNPSPAQVNSFATSLGVDPSLFSMMMLSGMTNMGGGEGMDISGMIPIAQIVEGYNPKIRNMFLMVMGQLEGRFEGNPIVAINADGSINKPLTVEYINGLEEGRDYAEGNVYYDSNSQPHELIKVGVDAQSIYDADPLNSTKALQANGMGTGRVSWKDVSLEVRQVAFYSIQTGEVKTDEDASITWLQDNINPSATRLIFSKKAPNALGLYNAALRSGSLPTLRVQLSRSPRRTETMPRRRVRSSPTGIGESSTGNL